MLRYQSAIMLLLASAIAVRSAPVDVVSEDDSFEEELRSKRQVGVYNQAPQAIVNQVTTMTQGVCPGGGSLGRACDAKRPWPQCPPQSYCYAVNSVDIGPYNCCPVWSTYGAAWRPQTWFYPYYPPNPYPFPYPAGAGIAGVANAPIPASWPVMKRKNVQSVASQQQ